MQNSFNGGIFGGRLFGRSDLARYRYACEELQNFIPSVQGAAIKRSGTRFIKAGISPSSPARLIPFEVTVEQSYILELGLGVLRFYRGSGAVLEAAQALTTTPPTATDPVVLEATAHGYSTGDSVFVSGSGMSEINGRFFTITFISADTFELDGENGLGRTTALSGTVARHFSLRDAISGNSLPWAVVDLPKVKYIQNGDLLYLVHSAYPPHELIRTSDLGWTCVPFAPVSPPFETENITTTALSIDITTVGVGRVITSTASLFTPTDVGRQISIGEILEAENGLWAPGVPADKLIRGGGWAAGAMVYFDGRVYEAQGVNGGNTGFSAPLHEEGIKDDGENLGDMAFWNFGTGIATITGYTSATQVTVDVTVNFPKSAITGTGTSLKWAFGAWDEVNGYPGAVAFYENRLWFGGTLREPQTFWGSKSGAFNNYSLRPADKADSAVQFTLLSDKLNSIEWMLGEESLLIGTRGGEYSADSGSATEAITPSNVRVRRLSAYGSSSGVQPRTIGPSILFVRRSFDLNDYTFDFDSDKHVALDLTRFAPGLLKPGVLEVAYQSEPFKQVWCSKLDGTIAAMTFVKDEDVLGWATVILGGPDAFVESIAVIPHPDGDSDQVWVAVRRTVGGGTVRYIELFEKVFDEDDLLEDAFFMESGLTYDGAPTLTIPGLWHLEGETVRILADGARQGDRVVTLGSITLDIAAGKVQVGLPMGSARLRTVRWNASAATTSTTSNQGFIGRLVALVLRVQRTGDALEFGSDFDKTMDTWERRTASDPMDAPVPLFTGDSPIFDSPSGWDQNRQIAVRHDEPTPCALLSVTALVETEVP